MHLDLVIEADDELGELGLGDMVDAKFSWAAGFGEEDAVHVSFEITRVEVWKHPETKKRMMRVCGEERG